MSEEATMFACSSIGISGAQPFVVKNGDEFEARMAVAFFGSFQMPEEDLEAINFNPFDEGFKHEKRIAKT